MKKPHVSKGFKHLNEYNTCGKVVEPIKMNFADFLEHWIVNDCVATLNEVTILNYRKKIKNLIVPTLGKYKVNTIDRDKVIYNENANRYDVISESGVLVEQLPSEFITQYGVYRDLTARYDNCIVSYENNVEHYAQIFLTITSID